MSTDRWFAEFEREEAKRQDRLGDIRANFEKWEERRASDLEAALIEAMHCA